VSAAAYSPAIYEGMNLTGLGTGVLAREAAIRVGPAGSVAGIDLEYGMIAVACPFWRGRRWDYASVLNTKRIDPQSPGDRDER
jgi:hypothetical protein